MKGITEAKTVGLHSLIDEIADAVASRLRVVGPIPTRRLVSATEAATYLGLSRREVYNLISSRAIPAVFHGRRRMLDRQDLDDWIEANKRR